MAATLASLPLPADAESATSALLAITEILPDPQDGRGESEGEWLELLVLQGGELNGTVLTDHDGEPEFVFPQAQVEAGERIVVANGHVYPEGTAPTARVFAAGKGWWTFDNLGDDLAVISPTGTVEDHVRFGAGAAVDTLEGEGDADGRWTAAPPPGASLGRIGTAWSAQVPTPGTSNVALSAANTSGVRLVGLLQLGDRGAAIACPAHAQPFRPYLWTLTWGTRVVKIPRVAALDAPCFSMGAALDGTWQTSVSNELGSLFDSVAPAEQLPWQEAVRMRLADPWGDEAFALELPAFETNGARGATLLRACNCSSGWLPRTVLPVAPLGPARTVSDVRMVRAGPALETALVGLFENATATLEVNAYLLTASSIQAALVDAANRGVAVRLLLEGSPVGTAPQTTALGPAPMEAFNASGVWVRSFNTTLPNPARDHAKYAVADGLSVVVLTENFVGAALSASEANTGFAVFVNSTELAADLTQLFAVDFDAGNDRSAVPPPRRVAPAQARPAEGNATARLLVSPTPSGDPWVDLIERSSRSVSVMSLSADERTLGPSSPIGKALLAACRRGLSVHVLLSTDFDGLQSGGTGDVARALAASATCATFEVRTDSRPAGSNSLLHAKVVVADGERFILGSHNLVGSAFLSNREVSLLVDEPVAARWLAGEVEAEFARGSTVEAAEVALDDGASYGAESAPLAAGVGRPPSFEAFALAGGLVTLAAHVRRRGRRRRGEPKPPFWQRFAPRPAVPEAPPHRGDPLALSLSVRMEPQKGPPEMPFELRASPPAPHEELRPPRVLPPTAFELFDER